MKETSSIKERLIENMKEEYPLNVEYIKSYLPDYDFITIEKRYEDRPIDSTIIVETDGFLEKVNSYYKGEGNLGDLILVFSLLRSFVWDDTPIVEDEAESIDAVQEGTWKVPSDECSDKDVLKEIIKKSFDAKGIKVEELLENAKDYNTKNLIHSFTSDTKLSFKHFRELIELAGLEFSISVQDIKPPVNHYSIYNSSTDQTRCVKFDSLIINSSRDTNMDFHDEDEMKSANKSQDSSWVVGEYDGDFLSTDDYDENYDGFDEDDLSDDEDDEDEEEDSDTEYVDCPVSMIVRIKKSDADNLKRIENHIEEFVDFDSWPEIDSIYDVKVASPELLSSDESTEA